MGKPKGKYIHPDKKQTKKVGFQGVKSMEFDNPKDKMKAFVSGKR